MTTWDDKPNDYEHALKLLERIRNATIEECAMAASEYLIRCALPGIANDAAAAIRALKDKP